MNKLIDKLGIDETLTRPRKKSKPAYHETSNYVSRKAHANYQADLLFLPTTKEGYKYLLVVTDVWTRSFDIEPLKDKLSDNVKKAYHKMLKRSYLRPPIFMKTDNGGEFSKMTKDDDTIHLRGLAYRHQNQASVERLNQSLGRLFNGYMNKVEEKNGTTYREWTDILDFVRKELNKVRFRKPVAAPQTNGVLDMSKTPKYEPGTLVHRRLDYPENALGVKQSTASFRVGDYRYDRHPRKVILIRQMKEKPWFRYMVEGIPETTYAPWELIKSKVQDGGTRFVVERILGHRRTKDGRFYKIRWKGFTKRHDSWEPETALREDVPELLEKYNS